MSTTLKSPHSTIHNVAINSHQQYVPSVHAIKEAGSDTQGSAHEAFIHSIQLLVAAPLTAEVNLEVRSGAKKDVSSDKENVVTQTELKCRVLAVLYIVTSVNFGITVAMQTRPQASRRVYSQRHDRYIVKSTFALCGVGSY